MKPLRMLGGALALALFSSAALAAPAHISAAQAQKAIIAESVSSYPGNCACPYNTDRRGYSCGRRSAYSRKGGYGPMCYPRDVSKEAIDQYRHDHAG